LGRTRQTLVAHKLGSSWTWSIWIKVCPSCSLNFPRARSILLHMFWVHCDYITHNLIRILPNSKPNKYLLSNLHFTTLIQPLQSIRPRMLNTSHIQFHHKCITSSQLPPSIIMLHTLFWMWHRVWNMFLDVQRTPYNQGLRLNWICNLLKFGLHVEEEKPKLSENADYPFSLFASPPSLPYVPCPPIPHNVVILQHSQCPFRNLTIVASLSSITLARIIEISISLKYSSTDLEPWFKPCNFKYKSL